MGNKDEKAKMLDTEEEQKYERLRKLGQELHVPIPEAFLTVEVFDKNGKPIQKHHQRSHSWVRNAYNLLFCQLAGKDGSDAEPFGGGRLNVKRTSGAISGAAYPVSISDGSTVDGTVQGYRAAGGLATRGILVGSGTDAESFEDYTLQTQIAEGAGAGQLNHAASEAHAISYADTTLTNTLIRYFNNNSGGNVSVNEVALVFNGWYEPLQILNARDKLGATVEVPDTGQLKVTYTIVLVYPE